MDKPPYKSSTSYNPNLQQQQQQDPSGNSTDHVSSSGQTAPEVVTSNTNMYTTNQTINQYLDKEDEMQQKRTALAGQWRTPPTPFFPSGGGTITTTNATIDPTHGGVSVVTLPNMTSAASATTTTTTTIGLTVPLPIDDDIITPPPTLPHSAEDYAKALQEAYRRGAEAAARAAAQQMVHVASCPDIVPLTTTAITTGSDTATTQHLSPMILDVSSALHAHPVSMSAPAAATTTTSSTMSSPPVPMDTTNSSLSVIGEQQQQQQPMQVQVVHHHHHHHILPAPPVSNNNINSNTTPSGSRTTIHGNDATTTTTSPNESSSSGNYNPNNNHPSMIMSSTTGTIPPNTTLHQPSTDVTATAKTVTVVNPAILPTQVGATTTMQQQQQQQYQQRSVSLPDMSSYAAQQEEEKRQKRLARNRASARLRRLRKKNLVDAYEIEVGSLEKTMAQLQQHEWGCTNHSNATGVQSATVLAEALSMDRGQQKLSSEERNQAAMDILQQQLQFIQQLEDLMQEQYVLQQVAQLTLNGNVDGNNWNEWKDLQDTLQLSPDQCQKIIEQHSVWDSEWQALQTVKSSLIAMKDNNWLWNEGCASITDQFMSILHSNQISKLLLWADHNSETIEELDSVHAMNIVSDTPIFQFGMDNNPSEYLDDERMAS
jgi:bZIP transcription factor